MNAQWSSLIKWIIAGVIAVLAFIFIRQCNSQGWLKPPPPDTVRIIRDTTIYHTKDSIVYVPQPFVVIDSVPYPINIPGVPIPTDTAAILADYLLKRVYKDTVYKTQYGWIELTDTVYVNRITSRRVKMDISVPTITNTVTLTQPKRIIAYVGVEGFGWPLGGGASLGFKARNDNYYGVKAMLFKGKPLYGGHVLIPIKFR